MIDFVGKFESMAYWCEALAKSHSYILDIKFGEKSEGSKSGANKTIGHPKEVLVSLGLTDNSIRLIQNIYKEDFNNFNYELVEYN
jgi:hypothetical protein